MKNNQITSKINLEELAKKEQREYKAQWRAANRDKVKESNKKYWEKRALRRLQEAPPKKTNEA